MFVNCKKESLPVFIIVFYFQCGFFNRKKHSQVQEWKRASLYNRKSLRVPANDQQPYSAMEEKGPDDS